MKKNQKELKRFFSKRKVEVVLRMLRGESLDELSRELVVPASRLSEWLAKYNEKWLVERHSYRAPAQVRRDLLAVQAAAWLRPVTCPKNPGRYIQMN